MKSSVLLSLPLISRLALWLPAAAVLSASAHAEQSAARIWNERLLAAIRINAPNPPAHARNLFHTAVSMYNAWAAYDGTAVGYIYNEKVSPLPADVEAARHEAISYAAYRLLRNRFATGPGAVATLTALDAKMTELGYSPAAGQAPPTAAATPAELGKRIGQAILNWGDADGSSFSTYPKAYDAAINPNQSLPLYAQGSNLALEENMPLGWGIPDGTDPNFWQPLALSAGVLQNGISDPTPIAGGVQSYVGVQGLATTPFSLTRTDPLKPWIDTFGGPSRLSTPGNPSPTDAAYKDNAMDLLRKSARLNDPTPADFSPKAFGNNPLGADTGTGFPVNPTTDVPYPSNVVKRGDFFRVLAEFWADGPNSETPPGHWHVLANELSEMSGLVKRIRGTGPTLNNLEWDVKVYFALAAATHDAACAAWSLKRYYLGARPITMIRYMGTKGQCSDSGAPSYHPQGLPLEPGVVEVITAATAGPGGRHEQIWDVIWNSNVPGSSHIGKIAVYSWPGEDPGNDPAPSIATHQSLVRWQLAKDWLPFQRKSFNTPGFPGYVSGHSTFSRAAAEVLTLITGSHLFPGGFHHHTVHANTMQIDLGPSADVDLQWCSYYDAADQAGQSRRWGGIHPYEDDYVGRQIGSIAGRSAYGLAESYWTGSIQNEIGQPAAKLLPDGNVKVTWNAVRGMYHKVQSTTDLVTWTDATPAAISYVNGAIATDTSGSWIDTSPVPGRKFYRVVRSTVSP